jgi:23S rRNA-/tRNA-specific pseudouridylate synthase
VEPLRYIFRHEGVFAVYKPPGVHSVRLPGGAGGESVADALLAQNHALVGAGRAPEDAGLVHRLDRGTSGILLGASTRDCWDKLFQDISEGRVRREYVACVAGEVLVPCEVSSFIGSPHRGAQKMKSYEKDPGARGRALFGSTTFSPLSFDPGRYVSLIVAVASPARRHQIRLHAASQGFALVGDKLYGSDQELGAIARVPREFFLHSWRVAFAHPITGERVTLESSLAQELQWPLPLT